MEPNKVPKVQLSILFMYANPQIETMIIIKINASLPNLHFQKERFFSCPIFLREISSFFPSKYASITSLALVFLKNSLIIGITSFCKLEGESFFHLLFPYQII